MFWFRIYIWHWWTVSDVELRSFPGRCWILCDLRSDWPWKQHPRFKVFEAILQRALWLQSQHGMKCRTAFVSLSLFNTLQGPFFLLPYGVVCIIQVNIAYSIIQLSSWSSSLFEKQGAVSIGRINSFLNTEEIDPTSVSRYCQQYCCGSVVGKR